MKSLKFICLLLLAGFATSSYAQSAVQSFGETITADGAIPYKKLAKKMAGQESVEVKLVGTVASVCKKKGCWMNVAAPGSKKTEPLFVQFKDYGFFMPLDCEGQKVIIQGTAYKSVTTVDELRHFAEDAGKSKAEIEAITEPLEELKFMASGVLMMPAGKGTGKK
ncbi:MAG: DUF4920 domain-containing protein [Saprospiraceae bacterium]|nr:DUF4920 domain-containing protein [Saprospiraceae bacterium]MDZ4704973.1 DUF4920 domain-containing protein [Saprospiraceae bacterium]